MVVLTKHIHILFCFDQLRHEPETHDPVGVPLSDFSRLSVAFESCLFIFDDEVLVESRQVAFQVVDWLQLNVLEEPDCSVHDHCDFSELL